MILALFIGSFMVGLILFVIGFKYWNPDKSKVSNFLFKHDSTFQNLGAVMTLINGMAIFILSISLLCSYTNAKAEEEELKEEYKAITYKINSDSFGLSNKEVVDEVQEWNMAFVHYQTMRKNTLVGVLYPDVYGELDTIEYENTGALEEKLDDKR